MKSQTFLKRLLSEPEILNELEICGPELETADEVKKLLSRLTLKNAMHELLIIRIDGIRVYNAICDEFENREGIFPSRNLGKWDIQLLLDEKPYSLTTQSSLIKAARHFAAAEDYYEEFGIDPISLEPEKGLELPSQLALKRMFVYCSKTGSLTWRYRFPQVGENPTNFLKFNPIYAGKEALITQRQGQRGLYGKIHGVTYNRARVIWKLLTNEEIPLGTPTEKRKNFKKFVTEEQQKPIYTLLKQQNA